MKIPTIKKRGFTLRPFKESDFDSLVKHINNKAVAKWTVGIPYPYDKKGGREWMKKTARQYKERPLKNCVFAIDIDGEAVGAVGIHSGTEYIGEVGYWISEDYWNRGIVTRAVKTLLPWITKNFKFKRIQAQVFSGNEPSARVLEKAGFTYEGTLRKYARRGKQEKDVYMFAKIPR